MREWMRELYDLDAVEVDQPTLQQLLYRPPNADGSKKRCGNCVFLVAPMKLCLLHPKSQAIHEESLCNYHLYGDPHDDWEPHSGLEPLTAELSGFREDTGEGAACENCAFFNPQNKACQAASGDVESHAKVHALGFCAHHEDADAS